MEDYRKVVNALNQALEDFDALIHHELKPLDQFGLTAQQERIMFFVIRHEPLTAKEIAVHFNISYSAVSQVVNKLEKQGMVVRQTNADNRRESYIKLGESGKRYALTLSEIDDTLIEKYYSKADLQDLKHMLQTLENLNQKIKTEKK
ncbi:MarR family winged helix-turn-helix transcriptional regulator [Melghirimyces algeriensis]|uniref:MarR family winged helix-turn-helix transcriptional regulator n=1 Tax=Melghirimyces algeriensis TaxID=910412 RepID=UPI001FE52AE1|nr:helix-turn-helix domain-containing protein [Melghirimyces algeriensis]